MGRAPYLGEGKDAACACELRAEGHEPNARGRLLHQGGTEELLEAMEGVEALPFPGKGREFACRERPFVPPCHLSKNAFGRIQPPHLEMKAGGLGDDEAHQREETHGNALHPQNQPPRICVIRHGEEVGDEAAEEEPGKHPDGVHDRHVPPAVPGGKEFGQVAIVHWERSAHTRISQQPEEQEDAVVGRECRRHAEDERDPRRARESNPPSEAVGDCKVKARRVRACGVRRKHRHTRTSSSHARTRATAHAFGRSELSRTHPFPNRPRRWPCQ